MKDNRKTMNIWQNTDVMHIRKIKTAEENNEITFKVKGIQREKK